MQFNKNNRVIIENKDGFVQLDDPGAVIGEILAEEDDDTLPFLTEEKRYRAKGYDLIIGTVLMSVIILFCVATAFLTPSGVLMQEKEMVNISSKTAKDDIKNGVKSIKNNIVGDVMNLPKVYLLPISGKGGTKYNRSNSSTYKDENGVKHMVYEDPTIKVDIWSQRGRNNGKRYVATYAKIKIAHPTQIRTAVSTTGYANRSKARKIARGVNAVFAINGDFYTLRDSGIIIKQGTKYKKSNSTRETLFIDSNGDFKIMSATKALKTKYLENNTIYNTMSFGPALVKDGKLCHYTSNTTHLAGMHFGDNPRTGIGQLGPLEYLAIVVDGRASNSWGITTNGLAKLFYEAGCTNAYNLDGGQSATMVFMDNVVNSVSNSGERNIADILYFASAYPKGGDA